MKPDKPAVMDPQAALLDLADMVGPVAHELRNVFNNIVLKAAVVARSLPENLRDSVSEFRTLGLEANDMLAQLDRIRQAIQAPRQAVDVPDVVQAVVAHFREQGQPLGAKVGDGLPRVWGNPLDARRLLLNLARIALTDNHAVTIHADQREGRVRLIVPLAGPPLTPEQVERFFDPFAGGLERAACQSIAKRLQAELGVENQVAGPALVVAFEPAED